VLPRVAALEYIASRSWEVSSSELRAWGVREVSLLKKVFGPVV